MSLDANVSLNERQLAAARDAAPLMVEILEGFILAHETQNDEVLAAVADTALEVVRIVMFVNAARGDEEKGHA